MPDVNRVYLNFEAPATKSVTSTASNIAVDVDEAGISTIALHHVSGSNPVYFRFDGTAAVVGAASNLVLLPGASREFDMRGSKGAFNISVISAGTPTVHVEVFK